MKKEHTPLPWKIRDYCLTQTTPTFIENGNDSWSAQNWDITSKSQRRIAEVTFSTARTEWSGTKSRQEAIANAEFIVSACNSHYDLLDALKEIISKCPQEFDDNEWAEYTAKQRAAIAKAEELNS